MRKLFIAVLSIILLMSSVNICFAHVSGGEPRFAHVSTNGVLVSYVELSELCVYANELIKSNYDSSINASNYPSAQIVNTDGVFAIALFYSTTNTSYYLCPQYNTLSSTPGRYYSSYNTDNILDVIRSNVVDIRSYCSTISSRLIYSTNNTTYTAGQMLYNIWAQLGSGGAIYGAIDNVETFLSSINSSLTSVNSSLTSIVTNSRPGIYVTGWNGYGDGTAYTPIRLSPDAVYAMIAYLNANYVGKPIYSLVQGNDPTNDPQHNSASWSSTRYFSYAYLENGYLRIAVTQNAAQSPAFLYAITANHRLIGIDTTYTTLGNIYSRLGDIETTLSNLSGGNDYTSVLNSINTALYGTAQTRAAELIPVGQTALTIAGSASSMLSAFTNSLLPLGVIGLIQTGVGAIDTVMQSADFVTEYSLLRQILATQRVTIGVTEYSTADLLRLISNYTQATRDALRVTIDGTQYSAAQLMSVTAERTNDIYEWLQGADLLNDNLVVTFINTTKDDFNSALLNGNNIVSLFYHAYRNVIPSVGASDWSDAVDYFDNLMGVS